MSHSGQISTASRHPSSLHAAVSGLCAALKSGHLPSAHHLVTLHLHRGSPDHALKLFDGMLHTANVVSWTSLMAELLRRGMPDRALAHFRAMLRSRVRPNAFTLSTAAAACSLSAAAAAGAALHARAESTGLLADVVVATSLLDMYAKCNLLDDARRLFDGAAARRNVVTWGAMIAGYARAARGREALELFSELSRLRQEPNQFILSSITNACASMGRLRAGECVHAAILRRSHEANEFVAGALVDMYTKCGCIEKSELVFQRIPSPTLVPYTSMIVSYAKHGRWRSALGLFNEMIAGGIRPNEVTFVGVLHACSHSGLVDEGMEYLHSMLRDHGVRPGARHYTCAVGMVGRAGRIDEAFQLSKRIHADGDDALLLWTSLISAGRKHRRLDIVEEASRCLVDFDRDVAGAYVVTSNAYALAGNSEDASAVRREMRHRGIYKDRGCSWVEIRGVVYAFYEGDISSCGGRKEEVVELVMELEEAMRRRGYMGGGGERLLDDGEEEGREGVIVGMHSERLALAFGLVSTKGSVTTIRVMKNLRICDDCHEAFKLICGMVGRRFVVRDLNRFHHFDGGSCNCGDYW